MGINRHWLERKVTGRRFALADLAAVAIAAALWFAKPELGPWPLAIALLPWLVRIVARQSPFRRTGLEIPLAIFLVMAAVGVWVAYDTGAAWAKFWILVSAVLFFIALAGQPQENQWPVVGLFGLMGVGVAVFFLLTHDWAAQVAKIPAINGLGESWMAVRPAIGMEGIGPNEAAGIMAMTVPLLGAFGVHLARKDRLLSSIWIAVSLFILLIGLVLTSSRGALISLVVGLIVWGIWALTRRLAARVEIRHFYAFLAALLLIVIPLIFLTLLAPSAPLGMLNALPGPASAGSRLQLARATVDLIGDFPFTGGGLQSFPGLYSQYIRNIPHLLFDSSHNLYLNVALEQGLLGLAAFAVVLIITVLLLVDAPKGEGSSESLMRGALLAGVTVMLLHGLVTDALYGIRGTPILFLFPALAYAVARPIGVQGPVKVEHLDSVVKHRLKEFSGTALLIGFVALSLQGVWQANMGAVEMARVELAEWPTGVWDDGSQVEQLARAEGLFSTALGIDPTNRTANHRMGLIRMLERDYDSAIGYLETAYAQDSEHRGIQKALGQSYAWTGQFDRAYVMLAPLPESGSEIGVYQWWWGTQGREDLASYAQAMSELLGSASK